MKFTFNAYNRGGFGISIVGSDTPVNYQHMDEEKFGKYDWQRDEVYESLPACRRAVKTYLKTEKLTADDRRYKNEELREVTIDGLIDEMIEDNNGMQEEMVERLKPLIAFAALHSGNGANESDQLVIELTPMENPSDIQNIVDNARSTIKSYSTR